MTSPDHFGFEQGGPPPIEQAVLALGNTAVLELLSPDQVRYTQVVTGGMVETLGLLTEQVELVVEQHPAHGSRAVAIDASPNGQFIGLYRDILAKREENPDWYTLLVEGERIDPLKGCTAQAYSAMIEAARARGERYLPDSLALNQHNGYVWTATMMTGDPLPELGKITIASSSGGSKIHFVNQDINRGGKSFRVRPAVVVGHIE